MARDPSDYMKPENDPLYQMGQEGQRANAARAQQIAQGWANKEQYYQRQVADAALRIPLKLGAWLFQFVRCVFCVYVAAWIGMSLARTLFGVALWIQGDKGFFNLGLALGLIDAIVFVLAAASADRLRRRPCLGLLVDDVGRQDPRSICSLQSRPMGDSPLGCRYGLEVCRCVVLLHRSFDDHRRTQSLVSEPKVGSCGHLARATFAFHRRRQPLTRFAEIQRRTRELFFGDEVAAVYVIDNRRQTIAPPLRGFR